MATKTFSDGVALPASDINTYLANAGLVFVKSQTVGTAVTSIAVTSAFSSTYDNYRIIYWGGTASAATGIKLQLGASTTGYYGGMPRADISAAALNLGMNNTASWSYAGMGTGDGLLMEAELYGPNAAAYTLARFSWIDNRTSNAWGIGGGVHRVATAYTDFTLLFDSTITVTGGTITVYGYRKG